MDNEQLNLKQYNKIAIMGGTFNPIHNAHLFIAEIVREKFNIDKVIFIPTGNPPHKNTDIADKKHRYIMTQLATISNEKFIVSSMEIDRKGMTYTIDTLLQLKKFCSEDVKMYFITGTDTINQIFSWKKHEQLFEHTNFVVIEREGYTIADKIKNIPTELKEKIFFCEVPRLEISSTDIRRRLQNEQTIDYLTPNSVKEYIRKNNLYKKDYTKKYERYIQKLKEILPEKRFNHSLEVAKEAKKLANHYNFDEEKAFLTGILHDCAKCFDKDLIQKICDENGYVLDEVVQQQLDLAHSFLGYFVAKNYYNIQDEDILNSIKYHTTGKANMNLLEKIIYIADYIEPTRKYFKEVDKARYLAYQNLDKAMAYILKNTIQFNQKKGRIIHHLSKEAYEYYK